MGKKLYARVYEDYYLNKDQTSLSDEQFENAKVAVIVPDGADENSPIFYMVDNSGWLSNAYKNLLSNGSSYSTSQDGKGNQAALAFERGICSCNGRSSFQRSDGQGLETGITLR